MKALILAAGFGSRLAPITDNLPKSLVPVNGKAILMKQIENLLENGIDDITIVSGYKAKILEKAVREKYPEIQIIESVDYATTNNMYSAYLAKDTVGDGDFLMMNADVFFDSSAIKALLACEHKNAIVVDIGRYMEESMKVVEKDNRLVEIAKAVLPENALGCSIDVYKFSKEGGKAFFAKCAEYIEEKKELKQWSEVALNDILPEVEFKACPLEGRWLEIDNHDDLAAAEKLFSEEMNFKACLLDIFRWFHKFCVENNLRYYMIGGTMLGAIRHKGFIPWDDDIDVAMPRPDYDRFLNLAEGKLYEYFFTESSGLGNKDYLYPYAKVFHTKTTLYENTRKGLRRGLYLDVFPLDGIGNTLEESVKNYKPLALRLDFLATRIVAIRKGRKWYKNLAVHITQTIPDKLVNEKRLISTIDKMCASRDFDKFEYVGNLVSSWRNKELMKRANFGKPTLYQFENLMVYGVENYDSYLTTLYGNWRELPPESKRVSNHANLHYDLYASYME